MKKKFWKLTTSHRSRTLFSEWNHRTQKSFFFLRKTSKKFFDRNEKKVFKTYYNPMLQRRLQPHSPPSLAPSLSCHLVHPYAWTWINTWLFPMNVRRRRLIMSRTKTGKHFSTKLVQIFLYDFKTGSDRKVWALNLRVSYRLLRKKLCWILFMNTQKKMKRSFHRLEGHAFNFW